MVICLFLPIQAFSAITVDAGRPLGLLYDSGNPIPISLSGTSESDVEPAPTLSHQWTVLSAPDTVSFSDSTSLSPTVTLGGTAGRYDLQLESTDLVETGTDTVTLFVYNSSVSTDEGSGADAAVFLGLRDKNYGADLRLTIRNTPNFAYKTYLRFDVSSLTEGFTDASLLVNITGIPGNSGIIQDSDFQVFGLEEELDYGYRKVDENWVEGAGVDGDLDANTTELSWTQSPANTLFGGSNVNERFATLLGTFQSFQNRQRTEFLISDSLREFIERDTDGQITLIITKVLSSPTPSYIASKELAASDSSFVAPQLLLVTDPAENALPKPSISANTTEGDEGSLTVNFDASSSSDPDGTITEYIWDFAETDDSSALITTTVPTISHSFSEAGNYPVSVRVRDNTGALSPGAAKINIRANAVWNSNNTDIRFPVDAQVVDVTKAPFFAKGDGVNDDTSAIQAAIDFYGTQENAIIYLPIGTYLISDTLLWPATLNPDGSRNFGGVGQSSLTILQGQNRDQTIIRLADSTPGFDDPANSKALVFTGNGAAQRFRNSIRNLTFHTGDLNPGATGVNFMANNQGTLKDVLVIAGDGDNDGEDGDGVLGVNLNNNENGPCLIKNVEVRGFDRGLQTMSTQNSVTMENITLYDQKIVGIDNRRQALFVRNLYSENKFSAPAITNFRDGGSFITLVDATLINTGTPNTGNAIGYIDSSNGFPNRTNVFLRNITVEDYKTAINVQTNNNDPFPPDGNGTAYIDEFVNDTINNTTVQRLWPNLEKSLSLDIEETITAPWGESSGWVNILDFLTDEERFMFRDIDLSAAIQAALNSGAHTVYFPRAGNASRLEMNSDVTVPTTVRRIIGLETNIGGEGRFIIPAAESTPNSLIFERLYTLAGGILHESSRPLGVLHSNIVYRSATTGAGDFYGEDFLGSMEFNSGQNVWLRQFNSECASPRMRNNGGTVWIFGIKTECIGPVIETYDGGTTEVLGAFFYTTLDDNSADASEPHLDAALPAFITVDSSLSVAGYREQNFVETGYSILAEETRLGDTRQILDNSSNDVVASAFMLYNAYAESDSSANTAPTSEAGMDQHILFPGATSIQLEGMANDDGYPNMGTTFNTLWEKVEGPGTVSFTNDVSPSTTATFNAPGIYELRLTAFEGPAPGDLSTSDTLTVRVFNETIDTSVGQGADSDLANPDAATVLIRHNNFGRRGYFRFDISSIDLEQLKEVGFFAEMNGPRVQVLDWTFNVFGLLESPDYGMGINDEFWDEATTVSSTAPGANIGSSGGVYNPEGTDTAGVLSQYTTHLGQFFSRRNVNESQSINTQALKDFITSDTNGVVTLIITREEFVGNSGQRIDFASKENNHSVPAPTLNFILDSDNDGDHISDLWELANGLDPSTSADATLDTDMDGINSFLEFALGGNPSVPDVNISPSLTFTNGQNPTFGIRFREARPELNYDAFYSTNLTLWLPASNRSGFELSDEGTEDGFTVKKAEIPAGPEDELFLRLEITD